MLCRIDQLCIFPNLFRLPPGLKDGFGDLSGAATALFGRFVVVRCGAYSSLTGRREESAVWASLRPGLCGDWCFLGACSSVGILLWQKCQQEGGSARIKPMQDSIMSLYKVGKKWMGKIYSVCLMSRHSLRRGIIRHLGTNWWNENALPMRTVLYSRGMFMFLSKDLDKMLLWWPLRLAPRYEISTHWFLAPFSTFAPLFLTLAPELAPLYFLTDSADSWLSSTLVSLSDDSYHLRTSLYHFSCVSLHTDLLLATPKCSLSVSWTYMLPKKLTGPVNHRLSS